MFPEVQWSNFLCLALCCVISYYRRQTLHQLWCCTHAAVDLEKPRLVLCLIHLKRANVVGKCTLCADALYQNYWYSSTFIGVIYNVELHCVKKTAFCFCNNLVEWQPTYHFWHNDTVINFLQYEVCTAYCA